MPHDHIAPKRVAFISALTGVPWGGSEELWSRAAALLQQRGHTVFANTHWWSQKPTKLQQLENGGVQVTQRRFRARDKILDDTLWRGRLQTKIYGWLDEVKPELVVISLDSQCAGSDWMAACIARNLPYVLIVQAVIEQYWPGDAANLLLAEGYRKARKIYCVSHKNREWLQTQFAQELPQTEVTWNPFNVPFEEAPAWPSDDSSLRLACIGRLDPVAKGHDILFRVLQQPKWKTRTLTVSVIGEGGYEQSLRNLAQYCGLHNVTFVPFTNDIRAVWQTHHGLVLPSRFEGFPLVVLEAMFSARPCMVTDVAGNAELIEDGVSGFVAKAPTVEFVDEALERLWSAWESGTLQTAGEKAAQTTRSAITQPPEVSFTDKLEALLISSS